MLGDRRLLQTIRLKNFLSFDESSEEIELKSLNVLIGPNASGKSNLIEAVGLLKATPNDLLSPIREGGGVAEWIWKGRPTAAFSLTISPHEHTLPVAEIDATVCYPQSKGRMPLRGAGDILRPRLQQASATQESQVGTYPQKGCPGWSGKSRQPHYQRDLQQRGSFFGDIGAD